MANVRAIPWMQKIVSYDGHTNGDFVGWHNGQLVIYNVTNGRSFTGNSITMDGINWWADTISAGPAWTVPNLFDHNAVRSEMVNGNRHNTCFFIGDRTNATSFYASSYTYPMSSVSSMVRNAIGFSCLNNCKGSYSNGGGGAQAYLEKVGMFYADPNTGKRYTYIANQKVSGSHNLNQLYPNDGNYYYCYRLSDGNINSVNNNKLVLMGMGFQFVHSVKTAKHTSMCNLKHMRIIVGDSGGLVTIPNRLLICDVNERTLQEHKDGHALSITY